MARFGRMEFVDADELCSRPFDVEAAITVLPKRALARGMFLTSVVDACAAHGGNDELHRRAGLAPRRNVAFTEYPYAEFIRLAAAAATLVYPNDPTALGMRRIAQSFYPVLADSLIGRVVFGVVGRNFGRVLELATKGWQLSLSFDGAEPVQHERVGPKDVRLHFKNFPILLTSAQPGVVEGAAIACGEKARVRVALSDPRNAVFWVTW
jgi:uncharacterized protein (TIGR02265 family)